MKVLFMLPLLLAFANSTFAHTDRYDPNSHENYYSIRYCGVIYKYDHTPLNQARIRIGNKFDNNIQTFNLSPINNYSKDVIQSINNDAYSGCVHSNELPIKGYEGNFIRVGNIELHGQHTGFSVSN